jgi:hypothetical protein
MSSLLVAVISELVLIPLNLDFEIDQSWMNLGRILNDIHIQIQILSIEQLLFVLSFIKGCVHLSFEKKIKNDLPPTLIASLT